MKQSATGFCKRLHGSISAQHGQDMADAICGDGVGSAATPAQKSRWAAEVMERLASNLGPDEQAAAMAGCACGPSAAHLEAGRKVWLQCASLQEYCDRRNAEMKGGAHFETRDGLLYVSYPRCYCSMVKNSPNPIPKTWCLCSCEYTRRACAAAFGRDVEVRLLKSVIGGDGECLFEVK